MVDIHIHEFFYRFEGSLQFYKNRGDYQTHYIQWVPLYADRLIRLNVFLTVHHELTICNYQLDALIIIYS